MGLHFESIVVFVASYEYGLIFMDIIVLLN